MEIKGKILKVLDKTSGTSKAGKEWVKGEFVIDTGDQYNPEVCFSLFGDDKINMLSKFEINQKVDVSFNVSSREYNGKYFHNLDCWKIKSSSNVESATPESNSSDDDQSLPF